MPTPVKMPQLGETIFEGTVARWLKQPGDAVDAQEPLLDITTDKIDTEVPAPSAGTLLKIVVEEGITVRVGTVIAYIGDTDETPIPKATTVQTPDHRPQGPVVKPAGRAFISPIVARISAKHNIDLERVTGSGLHGRITKKDVLAFIETQASGSEGESQRFAAPVDDRQDPIGADEILQPLSAMRQAIAEHMTRSVHTSSHVTTVFEADMKAVVLHRQAQKQIMVQKGIHLTFTPYFVAAVASALRDNPLLNSRLTDDGLVQNRRIHIGMAVAVADGLVVPVIHDADERNLQGLARAVNDLAERARAGCLLPDELQGGTFTVTNHGVNGSLLGTPIINQPQAAILGIGKISKRPVVRSGHPLLPSADDAIVIRPICYLSLSFDHRILDGARADKFMADVVKRLEEWNTGGA